MLHTWMNTIIELEMVLIKSDPDPLIGSTMVVVFLAILLAFVLLGFFVEFILKLRQLATKRIEKPNF